MLDVPQMDLRYNLQFIICNVGYSPEFNAIEAVFSKVKALYNRQRLNCLINKTFFKP